MSQKGYRVMQLWSGVAAFSVMAPVIIGGRPAMDMWPWFGGKLGAWSAGAVQVSTLQTLRMHSLEWTLHLRQGLAR